MLYEQEGSMMSQKIDAEGKRNQADEIFQYRDKDGKLWQSLAFYLAYLAETTNVLDPLKPKDTKNSQED